MERLFHSLRRARFFLLLIAGCALATTSTQAVSILFSKIDGGTYAAGAGFATNLLAGPLDSAKDTARHCSRLIVHDGQGRGMDGAQQCASRGILQLQSDALRALQQGVVDDGNADNH